MKFLCVDVTKISIFKNSDMNGFHPRPPITTTDLVLNTTTSPITTTIDGTSTHETTTTSSVLNCLIPFGMSLVEYGLTVGVVGALLAALAIWLLIKFILPGTQ